jgi:arsenate reductase-like glutaredoxin family protein
LLERKLDFAARDLDKQRLTESELEQLIGQRDYKDFLNTRNELYRSREMAKHPPTRAEALKLMGRQISAICPRLRLFYNILR